MTLLELPCSVRLGDQRVEPRARATSHEQLLVLERLQVRAGQLPVIVNTAIVPCPWCLPVAGALAELIGPVDAAGVTVAFGRLVWLVELF